MYSFETLRGELIDLSALTPDEQAVFLVFFDRAGGESLLNETVDPQSLLDPAAFQSLAKSTTRINSLNPERSLAGPLGEIVFDLSLRIGILRGWWTREAIRTNPRFSLREIYERSVNGVTAAEEGSQLDRSQRLQLAGLCQRSDVSITEVQDFLREIDWTLEPKPLKRSTVHFDEDQLTGRDFRQMHFAGRILTIASLIGSRGLLDRLLGIEFIARVTDDPYEIQQRILGQQAIALVRSAGLRGSSTGVIVIGLDRQGFAAQAWLPLALEWQWFERHGLVAVLVDEPRLSPNVHTAQLGFSAINETSWQALNGHFILPSVEGLWQTTALTQEGITAVLEHFRSLARQIADQSQLQPIVADVVSRWGSAFGCFENTRLPDFSLAEVQVHWQTLADFIGHHHLDASNEGSGG